MEEMRCYCGYDCGCCPVRLATVTKDPTASAAYREKARAFYRDVMHMEIPPEKLVCHGGRSDMVMEVCQDCPFRKCCRDRSIDRCKVCPDYPCPAIAQYEKDWINPK